jgi:hypothetical protein
MQFSPPRVLEGDFPAEKQVELPRERTLRTARPLGHGFDQSVRCGEPMDNEAGIRQPGKTDDGGQGGLHGAIFGKAGTIGDGNPASKKS